MEKNVLEILEDTNVLVTIKKVSDKEFEVIYYDKRTSRTVTYKRTHLFLATYLAIQLFKEQEMIY